MKRCKNLFCLNKYHILTHFIDKSTHNVLSLIVRLKMNVSSPTNTINRLFHYSIAYFFNTVEDHFV